VKKVSRLTNGLGNRGRGRETRRVVEKLKVDLLATLELTEVPPIFD
jgi:hypothetical protein